MVNLIMAALLIRQDLGIFKNDYTKIQQALTREEPSRTNLEGYLVLDHEKDPKFTHPGVFKAIFYCVSKAALSQNQVKVYVVSRSKLDADDRLREVRARTVLAGAGCILQPIHIENDRTFEYVVTPLCNRGTLETFLRTHKLTSKDLDRFCLYIITALRVCHKNNLLHRDIKPDNILIHRDEQGDLNLFLNDFGLSTLVANNEVKYSGFCGSPRSIAPEMWEELRKADRIYTSFQTDLWAIGSVLYYVQTGHGFATKGIEPEVPGKYRFVGLKWNSLFSKSLGIFHGPIRDLLSRDPQVRSSALDIRTRMENLYKSSYLAQALPKEPLDDKIEELILNCMMLPAQLRVRVLNKILSFM